MKSKYTIYFADTLGKLRKKIKKINKSEFGGQNVLKMSDDVIFELDWSGCYYEGDTPGIKAIIPYDKPKTKKWS